MLPRPQALRARDDAHFSWVFDFFTGIPHSSGMNPITALLGATGLLLVVAVVLSVMKRSHGDEEAEIRKLRAELDATEMFAAHPYLALRLSRYALVYSTTAQLSVSLHTRL